MQAVTIRCQVSRPFKNDFTLLREALKPAAVLDDFNAEFDLKLLNGGGKSWLRNPTDRRCPSKMTFLGERDQVLKLPRYHRSCLVARSSVPERSNGSAYFPRCSGGWLLSPSVSSSEEK